jgi:hypothetical protein
MILHDNCESFEQIIKIKDAKIAELEKKLEIAVEALEFYAFENNWLGINDSKDSYCSPVKWIRIVEDDMDNYLGGKLAREALAAINGEH